MGFFALCVIVFGILIDMKQHVLVAQLIVENLALTTGLLLLYAIYGIFHIDFQVKLLRQSNYLVFHQLGLFDETSFIRYQFVVWSYNHLLPILYTVFLSIQCIRHGEWTTLLLFWLFLALMFGLYVVFLLKTVRSPYPDVRSLSIKFNQKISFRVKRVFWTLVYLIRERTLLVLGSKCVSLLLLNLFFYSFSLGDYDERWLYFGMTCVSLAHFFIWREVAAFEDSKMAYFKNMPVSNRKIAMQHSFTTIQLLAPELLLLFSKLFLLGDIVDALELAGLLVALGVGFYSMVRLTKNEAFLARNVLSMFFVLVVLILYNVPVVFLLFTGFSLYGISLRKAF